MVILSLGEDVAPASRGSANQASVVRTAATQKAEASKDAPKGTPRRRSTTPKKETSSTSLAEKVLANAKEAEKKQTEKKTEKKAKSSRHASVGARRSVEDKENKKTRDETSTVSSNPKSNPIEGPEGAKIARAALLDLSQAFQTGNETAAMQALGQLMRNQQGLEQLSKTKMPGFDEKTTQYLQQALRVMSSEPGVESLLSSFNSMEVKDVRSDPEKNDAKGPVVKGIPLTPGWGDAPGNAPGVVPGSRDGRLSAQPPAVRFPEEEQRRMVAADWKRIQERSKAVKKMQATNEPAAEAKAAPKTTEKSSQSKSSFWKSRGSSSKTTDSAKEEVVKESEDPKSQVLSNQKAASAMDFTELFIMNAGIIGANMSYMQILLKLFEQLLAPIVNGQPGEAEVAADLVALRFFREARGEVELKDFRTSLLASGRALLPDTWDSTHETAWIAVWDCISEQLEKAMPLPKRYVTPVKRFVEGLSKEQRIQIGVKTFDRLFRETPEVSNYFKQSNMRLAFIVSKTLDYAPRLFDEPALMVDEMTQLGLKHIMFQAQSKFFHPWVLALVAEIQQVRKDEEVVEGMNYALCIIGSIIGQAVETGSTPVLQAVVNDDVRALKRALAATPRAERFEAVLGTANR
eukprot:symbB.v1.2.001416.t1/scaffold74.1/size352168/9